MSCSNSTKEFVVLPLPIANWYILLVFLLTGLKTDFGCVGGKFSIDVRFVGENEAM